LMMMVMTWTWMWVGMPFTELCSIVLQWIYLVWTGHWGNPPGFLCGCIPVVYPSIPVIHPSKKDLWVSGSGFHRVRVRVGPRTPAGTPMLLAIRERRGKAVLWSYHHISTSAVCSWSVLR
jgi:hypothetical protein